MKSKYFIYDRGKEIEVSDNVRSVRKQKGSALIIQFRGGLSKALKAFNKKQKLIRLKALNKEENRYLAFFPKMSLSQLSERGRRYHDSGYATFAEPYVEYKVSNNAAFTDPMFKDQWILDNTGQNGGKAGEDIGVIEALDLIASSGIVPDSNICLAVLDEGVDIDHKEFRSDLWKDNFSVFGTRKDPRPMKGDHHGTSITGLIAAGQNNNLGIAGINPFCKIMAGRIYYSGDGGFVKPVQVEKGIRQAVDNGARVINMSFKLPVSPNITSAIEFGFSKNVVFCGCSGNFLKANDTAVKFPGLLEQVICVGAIDNRSAWIDLPTSPLLPPAGSCFGREVDIVAPGAFLATTRNNNTFTNIFGGTSAACGIISAVAALILSVNPSLKNTDVRDILLTTADPLPFDAQRVGHGKVNALKAIQKAISLLQA